MANGGSNSLKTMAVAALATTALALAGLAAPSAGAASACEKWGNTLPGSLTIGQARDSILCLLNRERDRHGVKKFDMSKKLRKAAQKHSETMQKKNCFSHQCPGEGDVLSRLRGVGYLLGGLLRWAYAENIAWGQRSSGTPKAMVNAWMNSPGHRTNILNGALRDIGVGFVQGSPSSPGANAGIYTTDFGLRIG